MKEIKILIVEDEFLHACSLALDIISIISEEDITSVEELTQEFRKTYCKQIPMIYNTSCVNFVMYAEGNVERAKKLLNQEYSLITLDGKLYEDGHGRQVLEEMTNEQREVTIVISRDIEFFEEAQYKNLFAIWKETELEAGLKIKDELRVILNLMELCD